MAARTRWIDCPRCDATGRYKKFGKCYLCNSTKKTSQAEANKWATKEGKWRYRSGGGIDSLCRVRYTVGYLTPKKATLFCYKKNGHDGLHKFMQKKSERSAGNCNKLVAPIGTDAAYPCGHLRGHAGDCWVPSDVLNSGRTPKPSEVRRDDEVSAEITRSAERMADAMNRHDPRVRAQDAEWNESQRSALSDLVDLFKD